VRRVNVIGTSGTGKSTFGAALAKHLDVPYVEIDALNWGPNWQMAAVPELRERVGAAAAGDAWVIDGNYSASRDLVWARADTVIWLDLPLAVVMWQVVTRTIRRIARREQLWNGNRESLRTALGRDSIILWAATTYGRRRHDYPTMLAERPPRVTAIRLRSNRAKRRFLEAIPPPRSEPTPEASSR
jgi:adenylate kinase family enzyme